MRRVIKRYHPPGTAPGTLPEQGAGVAAPTTVSLWTYDSAGCKERDLDSLEAVGSLAGPGERAWLRVVGHDPSVIQQLQGRFGVHPLVLEDALNVGQHPKFEDHDGYLFVVVDVLRQVTGAESSEQQVSLLVFPNLLISIEERVSDLFHPIEQRLRGGKGKIRAAGPDYLAYALLDTAVDHFFPVLERLGETMEELEERLLERADRSDLQLLNALRRELLRLRRATWPLREMVSGLARGQSDLISEETRLWLRDVYDHTIQVMDIVETYREVSASLMDLYLSSISNRMNEVMKMLTIVATIFIPLGFIAGLYGMNFNTGTSPYNMPELNWYLGYPAALALMAAVAGTMLFLFWRKGWL